MMNRLHILGLVALLVAMVTGCGGPYHYDKRLTAADSIMYDDPDSALTLVETVNADSLATEGDRAYHDLLLTQARYRCYITATSDSDINRAMEYYRRHDREREKLTRSYIYKGAVMEELGHPDSAMLYYKCAEVTAAPDDYFNLGYTKMRIAELYQRYYTNRDAALDKLKQSARYFYLIKDTSYLISTIGKQGLYLSETNMDSAQVYLEKAIALAEAIGSPKRFMYQSKLAGLYFYKGDYMKAKNLAMDIIGSGGEYDEIQYYFYAARSFIKLSRLDSAFFIKSIIPSPKNALDSMNVFKIEAELAMAEHRHKDYADYTMKYKDISDKIYKYSLKSDITKVELKWDADMMHAKYKKSVFGKVLMISVIALLAIMILSFWISKRMKNRIRAYQHDILLTRNELEKIINAYEEKISKRDDAIANQQNLLSLQEKDIETISKEKDRLLSQQTAVKDHVAEIVRYRLSALNELYYDIRVKSASEIKPNKHVLPLMSLIKDLNDNKRLTYVTPQKSFWENLKLSVDGEYNGIATFVEKNFPSLTITEHHLFWLLCAKVSPQIIKLCMGYSSATTVSNYKKRLIKERMGLDMKFEQFLHAYLDGNLDSK